MPKELSLVERFRLLRRASKLMREAELLRDEVRTTEGANCDYCHQWRPWRELHDESTQTEQRPTICDKCIKRRQVAHESGWLNWPQRDE